MIFFLRFIREVNWIHSSNLNIIERTDNESLSKSLANLVSKEIPRLKVKRRAGVNFEFISFNHGNASLNLKVFSLTANFLAYFILKNIY